MREDIKGQVIYHSAYSIIALNLFQRLDSMIVCFVDYLKIIYNYDKFLFAFMIWIEYWLMKHMHLFVLLYSTNVVDDIATKVKK